MPRCIGLAARFKSEKDSDTLAQQRLVYQTQGNQDLPIIISEGSVLLAKTWWLRR